MSDAAATAAKPPNSEDSQLRPRVLIIDDETAIRESLEILLELEGFTVESAPDGEKGCRFWKNLFSIW